MNQILISQKVYVTKEMKRKRRTYKVVYIISVLLVNILTNPLVVYIYNIMDIYSFVYKDIILIILELLVVIVEGYIYQYLLEIKWKKSLIISFISNVLAYLIGVLLS